MVQCASQKKTWGRSIFLCTTTIYQQRDKGKWNHFTLLYGKLILIGLRIYLFIFIWCNMIGLWITDRNRILSNIYKSERQNNKIFQIGKLWVSFLYSRVISIIRTIFLNMPFLWLFLLYNNVSFFSFSFCHHRSLCLQLS